MWGFGKKNSDVKPHDHDYLIHFYKGKLIGKCLECGERIYDIKLEVI